jgi:hypothetical protein
MRAYAKRLVVGGLLLAVLAAAAGTHEDLARSATSASSSANGDWVVSSHSPLETASHWHSVIRGHEHSCLACHLHRFAAVPERAHDPAPAHTDQFVSHAAPQRATQVLGLSDPTRGPPSHS